MSQPTDRTLESIRAAHLHTVAAIRVVAAQAVIAVAWALYAAAAAVLVLMVIDFVASAVETGVADWPSEYWFAVVPLAVAAVTLHLAAARVARPSVRGSGRP